MSEYGYGDYGSYPGAEVGCGTGTKILLGLVIFALLLALIMLIIDTYFYPFITAQKYGGTCTATTDCRKGLACRTDASNPTQMICQESAANCPACVAPNKDNCKTYCTN